MNTKKSALLILLLIGSAFSFAGCGHSENSDEASKKANATQQPASDAPSLSNPKPAESTGK
jgi:hypothetical protein